MKQKKRLIQIGIVGCGAIGSRIARSIKKDLKNSCQLNGLYDIKLEKAARLAKQLKVEKKTVKETITQLIKQCDCMIEAVNAENTYEIIKQALSAKKDVLPLSVGKLLDANDLFDLAQKNNCQLLIPSGAIAGIDAVKAASLIGFDKITLTTRKPLSGFSDNSYLNKKGIILSKIKKETVIYDGNVSSAVKHFPQNINVAATLALASQNQKKVKVRIITSPKYKSNSHEIEVSGKFGEITTRTNNVICPDNPKTSYLAVLSGLQTLKQYCTGVFIGT